MNDEAITQHKKMAMDGLGSVESPFRNGTDHGAPSRGEMKDIQRKGKDTDDDRV